MKKTTALLSILLFSLCSFGQRHYGKFDLDRKGKNAPYGFLWIEKGKLAVKQSEVSVDQYLGFLEAITKDSTSDYVVSMKPSRESALYPFMDTSKTIAQVEDMNTKEINWLNEEKMVSAAQAMTQEKKVDYDSYFNPYKMPVTGISYEQALQYAKWCTLHMNNDLYENSKTPANIKQVTVFRLPTPTEFESILRNGMESCTLKDTARCTKLKAELRSGKNEKGCALCNCAGKDTCMQNKKIMAIFGMEALYPIYSFNPLWNGVYNMMGNAAEMTSEKGTAMGGSYKQTAKDCCPGSVQKYSGPEKWLGLRLVAEVVNIDGTNVYFNDEGKLIMK
jgi:formylglycine-generating enzyme required for sulfatase activity